MDRQTGRGMAKGTKVEKEEVVDMLIKSSSPLIYYINRYTDRQTDRQTQAM